jgi:hypothetical protein
MTTKVQGAAAKRVRPTGIAMSAKTPTEKVRQKNRQKVALDSRSFRLERDLTGGHDTSHLPPALNTIFRSGRPQFDSTRKQDA